MEQLHKKAGMKPIAAGSEPVSASQLRQPERRVSTANTSNRSSMVGRQSQKVGIGGGPLEGEASYNEFHQLVVEGFTTETTPTKEDDTSQEGRWITGEAGIEADHIKVYDEKQQRILLGTQPITSSGVLSPNDQE
jgi:hypothetical protein